MKLEADKKDLVALLVKTQNIVDRRNTMPVLVNVLLDLSEGSLQIFATDLEVSLTDQILVKMLAPGRLGVNAKNLFEIVKELPDGPVSLTKKESNWLEIRQNRAVFNMVGISPEEYPVFPSYSSTDFMKIEAKVLQDMIEKTIYSVSSDETRYHLNGVYFEKLGSSDAAGYRMVATDGHRLSLVDRLAQGSEPNDEAVGVIIPRKGLNELRKLLEGLRGEFEIAIEGAQMIVRHGSTVLMVRLIDGKYPNYQQLIPQNLERRISVGREAFLSSLKRVSLLSNQKSKGVTLTFSSGKMEITSNNPDLGDAKEEIEVEYEGSDLRVAFNARYILDVLNSFDDDKVAIELNDQLSPSLMRPQGDPSYTCVVMPMRI